MNDDLQEKRMAGDYEIIQGLHIGDREIVLGENARDETGMKSVSYTHLSIFPQSMICSAPKKAGRRPSWSVLST